MAAEEPPFKRPRTDPELERNREYLFRQADIIEGIIRDSVARFEATSSGAPVNGLDEETTQIVQSPYLTKPEKLRIYMKWRKAMGRNMTRWFGSVRQYVSRELMESIKHILDQIDDTDQESWLLFLELLDLRSVSAKLPELIKRARRVPVLAEWLHHRMNTNPTMFQTDMDLARIMAERNPYSSSISRFEMEGLRNLHTIKNYTNSLSTKNRENLESASKTFMTPHRRTALGVKDVRSHVGSFLGGRKTRRSKKTRRRAKK